MANQESSSLSIIKRAALRRQQQEAAADAADREYGKWQNRLKRALCSTAITVAVAPFVLLAWAFPALYPRDLEGFGILSGVSIVLAILFNVSYHVQEWVDAREKHYWLWRVVSVAFFLTLAGGMLYAMFATADFWLPHFR